MGKNQENLDIFNLKISLDEILNYYKLSNRNDENEKEDNLSNFDNHKQEKLKKTITLMEENIRGKNIFSSVIV